MIKNMFRYCILIAYVWTTICFASNENIGADSLYRLGIITAEDARYDESLKVFNKALKQYENQKDRKGQASTLNGIARVHSYKGEHTKSLKFQFKALEIKKTLDDPRSYAIL